MARPLQTAARPYSKVSIGLHWLMLLLLAAAYALIELRELYPRGSEIREAMKAWHFSVGLLVFALVWLRVIARIRTTRPVKPASPSEALALAVHLSLYALMIGMPILGWIALSADGKPIPFFGLEVPPLVAPNEPLAEDVEEIHEVFGTVGYWLVGLHTAAALFHHYLLRDGVLRRMLPGRA